MDTFKNPLETVQLIPIFSYLSILSDFLYIERYLTETNQNKPIPIVNGLYDYLQDNENKKEKIVLLIRNLLKGSDLYGAKENENFDITFVNVMFDYIITSLVFEKYGNIYGFLADTFLKEENIQVDHVLNVIKKNLEKESFENEYGEKSMLSSLSVNRIYNDIILPFFPRPNTELSLLSLDYIYAQAGCMFLRAGQINSTYYNDSPNNEINATDENLFDQYLVTGSAIERLILTKEKNLEMLKAFALPALFHYISTSKFLFTFENMAKVITNPTFWQTAYKFFFQYTIKSFNNIIVMIEKDCRYKILTTLSNFQSCFALGQSILEEHCPHLYPDEVDSRLRYYLFHPKSFQCRDNQFLPDPNEYFRSQINNITELYEKYSFQLIQSALSQYLIEKFEHSNACVHLLVPNNEVQDGKLFDSKHFAYNLLEVNIPKLKIYRYFVVNNEDYNITIADETDNLQNYTEELRFHFQKLKTFGISVTLKKAEDNITVLYQNFVKYKKSRLETELKILDNCQEVDRQLKFNWWKEFGLSLVPYLPSLIATSYVNHAESFKSAVMNLFYRYPNRISSKAIQINTQYFLSSLGTTVKSVFLRNATDETVVETVGKEKYVESISYVLNKKELFENIALNIHEPAFLLSFSTNEEINLLKRITNNLAQRTRLSFSSVTSSLSKISILLTHFYRSIGTVGVNRRLIYVNTLNNQTDTGYGYKFIFTSDNAVNIAQLRTCYELKDKRFLTLSEDSKKRKMYSYLSNVTFEEEPDLFVYEVNNQFWRRPTKLLFYGLAIELDDLDENCRDYDYFQKWKNDYRCQRRQRFTEKSAYEETALNYILKKTNLSDEEVHNLLGKYTFPDNSTIVFFVNEFIKSNCSKSPDWSEMYIIDSPDLLSELRYESLFDNILTNYEGEFRINALYSKTERHRIEEETSLKSIIESYNEQKARFSVFFHDYYAIRNFASTGHTRISGDTNEAKLMQLALYKLAIRQSDDPDDTFDLKLFRVETKPTSFLQTLSTNKYITLQKFTQAYPSVSSAVRFAGYPLPGFVNILYEFVFIGPYPRAKIEQFYIGKEQSVILLPGSEFYINDNTTVSIGGLGNVIKLKLKFQNAFNNKYVWYRDAMKKIAQINF